MSEEGKIFVGNLSYDCDNDKLYDKFTAYGKVDDAVVITDRDTGRSRGFGFVTFAGKDEASAAIEAENGRDFMGRDITVRKAESKRQGGGGGGGYGGGRRDYGGGRRDNYGSGGGYDNRRGYDDGYRGGGGGGYRGGMVLYGF